MRLWNNVWSLPVTDIKPHILAKPTFTYLPQLVHVAGIVAKHINVCGDAEDVLSHQ
jgi:hypothetical protein